MKSPPTTFRIGLVSQGDSAFAFRPIRSVNRKVLRNTRKRACYSMEVKWIFRI
jgi:hypothetical protein